MHSNPITRCLAMLLCALCLSACGRDELTQSEAALTQAWAGVEQHDAQRLEAAPAALDAARKTAGFDPKVLDAASLALQAANREPAGAALNQDPLVFDRYKRTQGELTGALFRVLTSAQAIPELREHPAMTKLRSVMVGDQGPMRDSRVRYSEALARYNQLVDEFPTNLTAKLYGFEARSDFVNRAAGG